VKKTKDVIGSSLVCENFGDRIYRTLGAHRKGGSMVFRVWVPHAEQVFLVGDVNAWCEDLPMTKVDASGIFEIWTDSALFEGRELYKYKVRTAFGDRYVADPYAFCTRMQPETASVVYDLDGYEWRDAVFLKRRGERAMYEQPLNIYQVFLGAWMRHADGSAFSYRELIFELIPYVKQMGYTHVMLMDAVNGGFSPNPCYGQPKELMALVDAFHEAGIGVVIPLASMGDCDEQDAVKQRLTESALFWAEYYHVDGIFADNTCRDFYENLGICMKKEYPDVLTIAEGAAHGDGFTYIWSRERCEELLSFVSIGDTLRKGACEHEILPISCDMVSGGKKSLLGKMHGEYKQKFAQVRALMVYLMTMPCKKLMFMGSEIGQFKEWDGTDVEWFLTEYDSHASLQRFFADLGHFYLENPPLYESDSHVLMGSDDREGGVISFCRVGKDGGELLSVINFSPVCYGDFEQKVPREGVYREVLNSDACSYGGEGSVNGGELLSDAEKNIRITLPPYGACVFKFFEK
jgi:1,4-alpha-glucan branching enzyme